MTCGIYCLYFEEVDSKYYIGCSIDIDKRYKEHCRALCNNTHHNYLLQNAYNKFKQLPNRYVLKVCQISEIEDNEIYYIALFNYYDLAYNLTLGGKHSYGEDNPNALYTNEVYKEIFFELAYSNIGLAELATKLDIPLHIITNISCGASHTWLHEKYPHEYKLLIAKSTRPNNKTCISLYMTKYKDILIELAYTNKTYKKIAEDLKVNFSLVNNIAFLKQYPLLEELYPLEYSIVMNKVRLVDKSAKAKGVIYPKIVSPEGIVYEVNNCRQFAITHNLVASNLNNLLNKKRKSHKGWKIHENSNS